ncbi:MAG: sugar phosphate isomerase/epimerase [Clostridia bacterium]|nr:sugar phosphate isomerase/epimerase [Clostridia bacterium]
MKKLGVQLYTIRDYMNTAEDIRLSFKRLKDMGYDEAQTAGAKIPYEEFAALAKEAGIDIVGTHENYDRMINDFDEAVRIQQVLGAPFMGTGGRGMLSEAQTEQFIKEANELGKKLIPYNMKFTFHNHSHEFLRYDSGRCMMEMLYEGLDKDTVSFCLDTYWVQNGGADVRHWIDMLKGRIDILHLKDMKKDIKDNDWFKTYYAEIGQGNLWWEGIMESAVNAGVKHYVVEQDVSDDPFKSLEMSSTFIHKNFFD